MRDNKKLNLPADIMTARQVADYLHLHIYTVHKYARQGKIPAFKIGADWRFHRKYIERWIKQKINASKQTGNIF